MRGLLLLMVLYVSLAGCASTGSSGSSVDATLLQNTQMAFDAAVHLAEFYPPASTRLVFDVEPRDAFGTALVIKLREEGFAVDETGVALAGSGLRIKYRVNPLGDKQFVLAVWVDGSMMSRLYVTGGQGVMAAGLWARGG